MGMSSQFNGMPGMGDVSSCSAPSCSGGGSVAPAPPPPPVPVLHLIETMIEFASNFDPTEFDLPQYLREVASQTGATAPEATIEAWNIILTYVVPSATTNTDLSAAIAAAMGIAEDVITILTGGRRLTTMRRLTTDKKSAFRQMMQQRQKSTRINYH